jgi:hypothetical protein
MCHVDVRNVQGEILMDTARFATVSLLLAACAAITGAQTPHAPLVSQTFKDSDGGWVAVGQTAKLTVSHESGIAQPDGGALKFDYNVGKGDFNAAYLQTQLDTWTKGKSFKFRIRADSNTMFAVALQEQDGGRYVAMIQVPKDTWQQIELSTSDFILAQDANDPKDPDGKLDMDRVTGLAISDVAQFLIAIDNPALASMFDIKQGSHTLYFDGFSIGTDPIPASTSSSGSTVQIETFAHPQLAWLSIGGMKLSRSEGKPLTGTAIRADYHQSPGKIALLNRPLPSWVLTGSKVLSFDVASVQPAKLLIQLEQYDGGKYNMMIDVPGGSTPQHRKLLLDGFARGDDSTDKDTKLHLALVKSMAVLDVTGLLDQADHENTLWLNHFLATTATN